MKLLPHWVLTDRHPSFYESETGSCIEMTAKVYAAMQELIKEYNAFVDSTNKIILDFKTESEAENEAFKCCITKLVETYIKSIDLAIDKQNLKIDNAVLYMKDNISQTTIDILNKAIEDGTITITESYDPETESLNMTTTGGV